MHTDTYWYPPPGMPRRKLRSVPECNRYLLVGTSVSQTRGRGGAGAGTSGSDLAPPPAQRMKTTATQTATATLLPRSAANPAFQAVLAKANKRLQGGGAGGASGAGGARSASVPVGVFRGVKVDVAPADSVGGGGNDGGGPDAGAAHAQQPPQVDHAPAPVVPVPPTSATSPSSREAKAAERFARRAQRFARHAASVPPVSPPPPPPRRSLPASLPATPRHGASRASAVQQSQEARHTVTHTFTMISCDMCDVKVRTDLWKVHKSGIGHRAKVQQRRQHQERLALHQQVRKQLRAAPAPAGGGSRPDLPRRSPPAQLPVRPAAPPVMPSGILAAALKANKERDQTWEAANARSPEAIIISGASGPRAVFVNGTFTRIDAERRIGANANLAPVFRKQTKGAADSGTLHASWLFASTSNEWFVGSDERMRKREPAGWACSRGPLDDGVLPHEVSACPWRESDGNEGWIENTRIEVDGVATRAEAESLHHGRVSDLVAESLLADSPRPSKPPFGLNS